MEKKPKNPDAFPSDNRSSGYSGMTLRDYFAAKAMQASRSRGTNYISWNDLAKDSYEIADAMLKQREL